jgi:[acyl-carrier-protein] S-malonyltransferase
MVKEKGGKAIPLKVSAPFHSYLMEPAQKAMAGEIEGIDWQQAGASFIPNVNAQIQQSYNVNFLIDQITQPVRWVQTLSAAVAFGVAECLEFGPGKVLTGLAKRELKDKEVQCLHILDLS